MCPAPQRTRGLPWPGAQPACGQGLVLSAEETARHPVRDGAGPQARPDLLPASRVLTAGPGRGAAGGRRAGASPPPGEARPAPHIRPRRCRPSPSGRGGLCLWRPPAGPAGPAQAAGPSGVGAHTSSLTGKRPPEGGGRPWSGPRGARARSRISVRALVPHLPEGGRSTGAPAALPLSEAGLPGPAPGWEPGGAAGGDGLPDAELALWQQPGDKGTGRRQWLQVPGQHRPLLRVARPARPPPPGQSHAAAHAGTTSGAGSRRGGASSRWPEPGHPPGQAGPLGALLHRLQASSTPFWPAQDLHWPVVTLDSGPT